LPKLTFQIIRRSIATLAQRKGTVKDVQGLLRHSRAATTTDVYMQEIPEGVQATVDSINQELRKKVRVKRDGKEGSEKFATNLLPAIEQLLTVRQVAQFLGVCTATVYKWAAEGVLPHVRIVNVIRIRPEDLTRFVNERSR